MTCSSPSIVRAGLSPLAAIAAAALAACGASDEQGGSPDAAYACEELPDEGSASFDLRVGDEASGEFVELNDGDEVTVVRGNQGFYMVLLEARAALELSAPADTVCLLCSAELNSDDGLFNNVVPESGKYFYHLAGDDFETSIIVVLGDDLASYTDASASLNLGCAGHGMASSVSRDILLRAP